MSKCCSGEPQVQAPGLCPSCGQKGKGVGEETLRHLLTEQACEKLQDIPYLFCRTPACEVVYFSEASPQVFVKSELRVRVGLKETSPPIPICYCFGFTREDAFAEAEATGRCTISKQIAARVKA